MARPIRCDQCGKEEELAGQYKVPPAGWLSLSQATDCRYWPSYETKDLCSIACTIAFLTACVAPAPITQDEQPASIGTVG